MKGKAPRKHSLDEKTAAAVLMKLKAVSRHGRCFIPMKMLVVKRCLNTFLHKNFHEDKVRVKLEKKILLAKAVTAQVANGSYAMHFSMQTIQQ